MSDRTTLHLRAADAMIVLVDLQERLMPPIQAWSPIVQNLRVLMAGRRFLDLPILYTEHYPKGLGRTHPPIAMLMPDSQPLEKITFSCSRSSRFTQALLKSGRRQIILAGLETHICVYLTALDMLDGGYEVHVPIDAVASRTEQNWAQGIKMCERAGCVLTTTETALYQMFERADTPQFKEFVRALKEIESDS